MFNCTPLSGLLREILITHHGIHIPLRGNTKAAIMILDTFPRCQNGNQEFF